MGNCAWKRKRVALYVVFFTLALFTNFSTLRSAKDRGSDVGRPLPSVRGTLRGQKPKTGALTSVGILPAVRGHPERLVGLRPGL